MKDYPKIVFRLLKIQGIGPKTAYKLVSEGAITKEVKEELKEVEENPLALLPYATERATEVITWLKKITDVKRVDPLGEFLRRKTSTIGDIDIAVATDRPDMVINHFVNFPKTQKIIEKEQNSLNFASWRCSGRSHGSIFRELVDHFFSILPDQNTTILLYEN